MTPLELAVPGDKSIAHRALIFAGLAHGESAITQLPNGADVASTMAMMRAFGAQIERDGDSVRVRGRGASALRPPAEPIDCGNSGTTARLGIGLAAALPGSTTFDGDASLRRRPMARVVDPLRAMGARIDYVADEGRLPVRVSGGDLRSGTFRNDVASAQVKSALLIAAVAAGVDVTIEEPSATRDHTERMMRAMGIGPRLNGTSVGWSASNAGPVRPLDIAIPGDVSSAAVLLAAALLAGRPVVIRDVGVNPTRTGFLDILRRMGAHVRVARQREESGEPVADLEVAPSRLNGTAVGGTEVVRAIDELPLVAVLGACAQGETSVAGAAELRAKESDRIRAVCANLAALGVEVDERADGFVVQGSGAPPAGRVRSFGDHRIAMAFAVLGLAPGAHVEVDDLDIARISYPGFAAQLEQVRAGHPASLGGGR